MSCFYLWPVWLHRIIPHYLITAQFSEKKNVLNIKCVSIFYNLNMKSFSFQKKFSEELSQIHIGLNVKSRYSCQILNKLNFLSAFLKLLKFL